jgi:cell division protein FtsB
MKALWESRKKVVGVVAIALLVLLMTSLNSRLSEYFRLSNERDKLSTSVSDLYATRLALQTMVAYATSDQAVEDWARNEAHMARPGDQVIVPIVPGDITPVPTSAVVETNPSVQNWQVWWALFFAD